MTDFHFDGKKVHHTEQEWKKLLTPTQFKILRKQGTEPAFENEYYDVKKKGLYMCAGCGLPIFSSSSKYDSGSGWPSFYQPIASENVSYKEDAHRIEVCCSCCNGHLGHVFDDGPPPTGKRYCMNSGALKFKPE